MNKVTKIPLICTAVIVAFNILIISTASGETTSSPARALMDAAGNGDFKTVRAIMSQIYGFPSEGVSTRAGTDTLTGGKTTQTNSGSTVTLNSGSGNTTQTNAARAVTENLGSGNPSQTNPAQTLMNAMDNGDLKTMMAMMTRLYGYPSEGISSRTAMNDLGIGSGNPSQTNPAQILIHAMDNGDFETMRAMMSRLYGYPSE